MTSQPQRSLTNLIVNQQISFKCQLCGGARRKSENCTLAKCAVHYLKTKSSYDLEVVLGWGGGVIRSPRSQKSINYSRHHKCTMNKI